MTTEQIEQMEAARALDARNAWDNGLSAYRAAREGKAHD